MPPSRHQHNKPIISLTNGQKLGEVKDVYLDAELTRVMAVFLGKEGLINRKALAVDRAHIGVMGVDAWLAASPDVVVGGDMLPGGEGYVLVGALRGREIHTEGGTKVATVDDAILDADGGVVGFTLGRLFVQGPLAERKTIARSAILNPGTKDTPMTTDLAKAEILDPAIA
jgi:uncharacterized protein YrrD